jgi:hypothetical protein
MSTRSHRFVLLLCTIPGTIFAFSLLLEHHAWFWDGMVYRCAIEATLANGSPYRFIGECAGYFLPHTYPYAGTRIVAGVASRIGALPLTWGYVLAYACGVGLFIRVVCRVGASVRALPLLLVAPGAGVFVSELVSGNVGVPFYGLLLWVIWRDATSFRKITALGALMAPFKPLYAAYLIVPFFLRREILLPALGAGTVAIWYAGDALLFPVHFAEWLRSAVHHANEVPGFGFSMLVRKAGLELDGQASIAAAYLGWAVAICALTVRAISRSPTPLIRALVAIAGTALLLPRLKEYDMLVLIPLALAIRSTLPEREQREWQFLVGGFAVGLPAAMWWLRKLPMLWGGTPAEWRTFVDMRWLVQNQGAFLFAAMLAALIWLACRTQEMSRSDETQRQTPDSDERFSGHDSVPRPIDVAPCSPAAATAFSRDNGHPRGHPRR